MLPDDNQGMDQIGLNLLYAGRASMYSSLSQLSSSLCSILMILAACVRLMRTNERFQVLLTAFVVSIPVIANAHILRPDGCRVPSYKRCAFTPTLPAWQDVLA